MARIERATTDLSENDLNRPTVEGLWSPGLIIEHLILSNEPYLKIMGPAIDSATYAPPETAIKHTFLGSKIRKAAGPTGNAPVPGPFKPRITAIPKARIAVLKGQMDQLAALAAAAQGKDLNAKTLRNPLFKAFRMNLVDAFAIIADHMERHAAQIEERSAARST